MVVPRTPRPPIIAPKPSEHALDPNEIERWVGRLARSIRLKRLEHRFRGGSAGRDDGGSTADDGAAGRG
jgi:hypothetical protein